MQLLLTLFTWTSLIWILIGIDVLIVVRAMRRDPARRQRVRTWLTAGCVLILGIAFFLFGTDKVIGWDTSAGHGETLAFYQRYYGLSPGFLLFTGWLQTLSAVLLIWHRRHWAAFTGAGLIFCTCTAAVYFHLACDPAGPFLGMPSIMGAILSGIILMDNLHLVMPLLVRIKAGLL